jgi:hypothetical protein
MTTRVRYALFADGTGDRVLLPLVDWVFRSRSIEPAGSFAEPAVFAGCSRDLAAGIRKAIRWYLPEVLIVHRDAEREEPALRTEEIRGAVAEAGVEVPVVPIVPVRMTEAWFCLDEAAIRRAAGNRAGKAVLDLPSLRDAESRPSPKNEVHEALRRASGLSGRRLSKFDPNRVFPRVGDYIGDFSPLRELPSFRRFESALADCVASGFAPGFHGGS